MKEFLCELEDILQNGRTKGDRTGTGTVSVFGRQTRYNVDHYDVPIVTTKRTFMKGVIRELLWMISGDTNIKVLFDNGVHIWDAWANENGDLGPVYGALWRKFDGSIAKMCNDHLDPQDVVIDQLSIAIDKLETNPNSRRILVSTWDPRLLPDENKTHAQNVADGKQALPPCHMLYHFNTFTDPDGRIQVDLFMHMRSQDVFLGKPFNIAFYSIMLLMVCRVLNDRAGEAKYYPGEYIHSTGDTHIYLNHMDQVKEQLNREPMGKSKVTFPDDKTFLSLDDFEYDDFIVDYKSHPGIKAPIAV